MYHALELQREAWPISAHAHWHSKTRDGQHAPRVCTLVLFIINCIPTATFARPFSRACIASAKKEGLAR